MSGSSQIKLPKELKHSRKDFIVKIRDIHKIEKKDCIIISVFGFGNREKFPIYVSKNTFKRHGYHRRKLLLCSYQRF